MTDRLTDPAADEAGVTPDGSATAPKGSADDRAQHASADVAPELFGW
ncbi:MULTISPECIES: hypothetical protein [Halorubrum]|nr:MULTISPECIES: hypothetical protein [Halorubrum]